MNENKIWYKVVASDFDNLPIGEVYGTETNVKGRKIAFSASELKEIKPKAGFKLVCKITSVGESECKAELESLSHSREHLSKMIRYNVSKLDIVVPVELGGKSYVVKVVCLISKAENKYKKAVQAEVREFLKEETKKTTLKELILDSLTGKVQNQIHKKLNKIYPTRMIEIRDISPYKK